MQLGILGLPKSGKTTLFNTLTASHQATDKYSSSSQTNMGVANVRDVRLETLRDLFNPKRYVPATVQYVDIPGMKRGESAESLDLAKLKMVDALVHVIRAFDDPEILHPEGSVDPARDMVNVDLELILADHDIVERRIERLDKAVKRGLNPEEQREKALLSEIILPALESEKPLREVELDPEDERRLRGFQLLSAKPLLLVINADESRAAEAPETFGITLQPRVRAVTVSAPIEQEISALSPEEQKDFLADLGLSEPSLGRVTRASYDLLGVISFFTVGEDEVRAWTIRRGTKAREAAGTIHSDIERGFIRAEVVHCDDLIRLKTMAACRDAGLLRLEGKEYVMKDGDVAHFRFNV
ncbi:MAG TPA: redox-regulated ATPase YchF [Thermoanaerobaculia bacterium]|nr:redox-regulated ATPase YchF [Thermoanaerobaculia bacterium]HSN88930.1 redox-regulated ATPase YchF [Thermoanaerobaculia bacterium]